MLITVVILTKSAKMKVQIYCRMLTKKWDIMKNNLVIIYKNVKTIIKFDETEIEKYKFEQDKNPISIYSIDIKKILIFDKVSFGKIGFKY